MFERAIILGLYSITPVHAGSGAELSVIDLPIQRERHTGFPVIWGQSLKGVLRSYFRKLEFIGEIKIDGNNWNWEEKAKEIYKDKADTYIKMVKDRKRDSPLTEIIFGPSIEGASEHAGAVSVGDAKILLFPVRSAKGVFAYVTCPEVLERFAEDLKFTAEITGKEKIKQISQNLKTEKLAKLENSKVIAGEALTFDDEQKEVVLEDVVLKANVDGEVLNNIADALKEIFGKETGGGIFGRNLESTQKRLAIVSNDIFRHFVKFATEIVARVRIDAEKGTVAHGGLWYEEFLPTDTLMYSIIAVGRPRRGVVPEKVSSSESIAKILKSIFDGVYLQIGGDETVGKGFVRVAAWG